MSQPTINTPLALRDRVPYTNFIGHVVVAPIAPILTPDSNGIIFRYDGSANIVVSVPNSLPLGFNVGFIMFGTGTITISAGSGATNRGGKAALTSQYSSGALLVVKNLNGVSAEFLLGGDFA